MLQRLAFALLTGLVAGVAQGNAEVCVRNYLKPEGAGDICARGIPAFVYAQVEADGDPVCLKVFDDRNCKNSPKEFDHVFDHEGGIVCVVNYHQPPISTSCATSPDLYQWIPAAYPQ